MLGSGTHHKARHILQEHQRNAALITVQDEACCLVCTVAVDHSAHLDFALTAAGDLAVIRYDTNGPPIDAAIAADDGLAVVGLVFVEFAAVEQSRQDLARGVGPGAVCRHNAVDLLGVEGGIARFGAVEQRALSLQGRELLDQRSDGRDGLFVGLNLIVNDARHGAVHRSTAERLNTGLLADGSFDQGRSGKEDRAGAVHDQGFIAHQRKVGAAGHAWPHDGSDLGDAHGRHHGIIAELASEMFFVREDLILHGQVDAGGVDQIDDGDAIFHRDLLCPHVLLRRHRKPCSGLHRGIVGNDHAFASVDQAYACHNAGAGGAAFGLVHLVGGEQAHLQEAGVGIQQQVDAFAGCEFALGLVTFDGLLPAAQCHLLTFGLDDTQELAVSVGIRVECQIMVNSGTDKACHSSFRSVE